MKKLVPILMISCMLACCLCLLCSCEETPPPSVNSGGNNQGGGGTEPDIDMTPAVPEGFIFDGDPKVVGSIVSFGQYPTTIKDKRVTVQEEPDQDGYYLGSDNNKYSKVKFTLDAFYNYSNRQLSDGTTLNVNQEYEMYFKVEPLKWRVLEIKDGKALLRSVSIVDTTPWQPCKQKINNTWLVMFDEPNAATYKDFRDYLNKIDNNDDQKYLQDTNNGVRADDWEYSYMRYYLNSHFYETAFNESQKKLIIKSEVNNGPDTIYFSQGAPRKDSYNYNDTKDNVFLLSYKDMNNQEYGFREVDYTYPHEDKDEVKKEKDKDRIMKNTDYVIAKGISNSNDGTGAYWTRSRDVDDNPTRGHVVWITESGMNNGGGQEVTGAHQSGIVPALWIDTSSLKK